MKTFYVDKGIRPSDIVAHTERLVTVSIDLATRYQRGEITSAYVDRVIDAMQVDCDDRRYMHRIIHAHVSLLDTREFVQSGEIPS